MRPLPHQKYTLAKTALATLHFHVFVCFASHRDLVHARAHRTTHAPHTHTQKKGKDGGSQGVIQSRDCGRPPSGGAPENRSDVSTRKSHNMDLKVARPLCLRRRSAALESRAPHARAHENAHRHKQLNTHINTNTFAQARTHAQRTHEIEVLLQDFWAAVRSVRFFSFAFAGQSGRQAAV